MNYKKIKKTEKVYCIIVNMVNPSVWQHLFKFNGSHFIFGPPQDSLYDTSVSSYLETCQARTNVSRTCSTTLNISVNV